MKISRPKAWTPVRILLDDGEIERIYVSETQTQHLLTDRESINEDNGVISADGKYATTMIPIRKVRDIELVDGGYVLDLRGVNKLN